MVVGGQRYSPAALPPGDSLHILQEYVLTPQPVLTGTKNLDPPTGFDLPTVHPAEDHETY